MALGGRHDGLVYVVRGLLVRGRRRRRPCPALMVAVFALVGPAMYVGVTLPDLVDVRGLVVRAVVSAVALVTCMSVFVLGLGLLDALGADDLNVGALAVVAALSAVVFHPTAGGAARRGRPAAVRRAARPARRRLAGGRPDRRGPAARRCGRSVRRWSCRTPPCSSTAGPLAALRHGDHAHPHPRPRRRRRAGGRAASRRPGVLRRRRAGAAADRARCSPRPCGPVRWPTTCSSPAARPSRPSRRSGAGCGATSTTGSGPGCPAWPSPPTPPAT